MINKEVIDYIKGELAKGSSKEKITMSLMTSGGWTEADVKEGFSAIDKAVLPPNVPQRPAYVPPTPPPAAVAPTPTPTPTPAPVQAPAFTPQPSSAPISTPVSNIMGTPSPTPTFTPPMMSPVTPPAPTFPPVQTPASTFSPAPRFASSPAPSPIATPAFVPLPQTAPASFIQPKPKNKKHFFFGLAALAISFFISYFSLFETASPENLQGILVFLIALHLIPVLTMQFVTKRIPIRSWGKSILAVGVPVLVVSVTQMVFKNIALSPIISGIILLAIVIGWLLFFSKIYGIGILRALKIGIFQALINAVIIVGLFTFLPSLTGFNPSAFGL